MGGVPLPLGRDLFAQEFEAVQRVIQRFVLLGKMQADEVVDRLAEEARARHRADADPETAPTLKPDDSNSDKSETTLAPIPAMLNGEDHYAL